LIPLSENLIQHLERSLKSAFNQPYVRLTRPSNRGSTEFQVQLSEDANTRRAYDNGGAGRVVLEIVTRRRVHSGFWFGFAAGFGQERSEKPSMRSASLPVFYNIGGELVPQFRADWDQEAALSGLSEHAQPHWHFVQRPERIERIVRTLAEVPGAVRDFNSGQESDLFLELADCGKFHFAMVSLWDEHDVSPHKRLFDSDDFPKWFEALTTYIAGQISYLVLRMPSPHREFEPAEVVGSENE